MKFFGHRGASALEAENTLASLHRALAESDGAEFDVQRTCDGVLVVLHDDTLARTAVAWDARHHLSEADYYARVDANVDTLTWEEVRAIRVGRCARGRIFGGAKHFLLSKMSSSSSSFHDHQHRVIIASRSSPVCVFCA